MNHVNLPGCTLHDWCGHKDELEEEKLRLNLVEQKKEGEAAAYRKATRLRITQ